MTATALRPMPVPDAAPPIEVGDVQVRLVRHRRGGAPGPLAVQGTLRLVLADGEDDPDDDFGPVATPRRDLPDPDAWSRGLVQVLVEVVAGQRPCTQLLRWTSTGVYEQVRRERMPPPAPGGAPRRRPQVRSVRVCEPADGVAEVCAVVNGQQRTHAVALRLEGHDGRWRITALETR
ncbi:Rv3235 family protein [Angustibacter sp. McL0619]|uniref:Rv3235 family protein n=1 Tax=Angustibacter sp. McL0619 TaxID=3415676 RepID=UPI003CF26F38